MRGSAGSVALVVLVLVAMVAPAAAEAEAPPVLADATAAHRWHMPRRNARETPRHVTETHPDDWNPLATPAGIAKTFLRDHRVTTDLFVMFVDQYANEVREGQNNYGTFAWRSTGDIELLQHSRAGTSYLEWDMNGTLGLNYDEGMESLSSNAGIISTANANVFPHTSALDELFWKQVSSGGQLVLLAGRIDQSFHFDTNRVANNSMQQMLSFSLMNNLSIPWPLYGGLGALGRWNMSKEISLMFGVGDSSSDEPWPFWKSVDDGSWYQLVELDVTETIPILGKGQYRLTPWHNHLGGEDGWGVGASIDQELGRHWLVGFFRFGVGDKDVTPIRTFVSGGVAVEGPFGRSGDYVAIGVAWSRPSPGEGTRDETTLEMIYRIRLTPTLELSPDLQLVFDPVQNPGQDLVVVPGIRLALVF